MALDYLASLVSMFFKIDCTNKGIATSVDSVEQLFSNGHLLLLHVHSHLSMQSTCALLCPNSESLAGLVMDKDIQAVCTQPELAKGEIESELEPGWDTIFYRFERP